MKYKRRLPQNKKLHLYGAQRGICWICRLFVPFETKCRGLRMSRDHIIQQSEGGSDEKQNVRLAHAYCNSSRHTQTIPQMRAVVKRMLINLIRTT